MNKITFCGRGRIFILSNFALHRRLQTSCQVTTQSAASLDDEHHSFLYPRGKQEFVVDPDLPSLISRLSRSAELKHSLDTRQLNLSIDIDLLLDNIVQCNEELQQLRKDYRSCLSEDKNNKEKETEIRRQHRLLKYDRFVPLLLEALKLPNFVQSITFCDQFYDKPVEFESKMINDFLSESDNLTRMSIEEKIRYQLLFNFGYQPISPYYMTKSAILEACGCDMLSEDVASCKIDQTDSNKSSLHLVGHSLYSYFALFARKMLSHNTVLPIKLFSTGTQYSCHKSDHRLVQYPVVTLFISDVNGAALCELYQTILGELNNIFKVIEHPSCFFSVAPAFLHPREMHSIVFFDQRNLLTARISLLGSMLSERVIFMHHDRSKLTNFMHCIYAEVYLLNLLRNN